MRLKDVILPSPLFHSLELAYWGPNSDPSDMQDHGFLYPLVPFFRTRLCDLGELGEGAFGGVNEGQTDLLGATPSPPGPRQSARGFTL